MNYIGEFHKDSTILLELLTKDDESQPIPVDFPPSAVIEHYNRNGLQEVDNVKLETMVDASRHTFLYKIPQNFEYGDYLITYKVTIDGIDYSTQEKFYVSRTEDLVQENNQIAYELLELIRAQEEGEPDDADVVSVLDGYVLPAEFAMPLAKEPEVQGNKLIFTLNEDMKFNHTYRIVLDKSIRSLSGRRLNKVKTITFTSEYKPLFSGIIEMQSVLKGTFKYFTPHDIYGAIRDAGEKAMLLMGNVADANNSRYRELRETDTLLFPAQKYVMHEASRALLTSLMVNILNGTDDDGTGIGSGMMNESGGSITLGDFSVSDKSSSNSSNASSSNANEETPLRKLRTLLEANEKELVFWRDSMMGRNRRGYASPVSGSFKSGAGTPEGRDFF